MNDRAALLAAIRANPRDEALRLVYADWLEEYGDDEDRTLADFIRVQCRLEPMRDGPFDERAEALRQVEERLLHRNRYRWLGPAFDASVWKNAEGFDVEFRRGMVERLVSPLGGFLELAESLGERHPAFHELVVLTLNGLCGELARCPQLAAVRDLTLSEPLTEDEALAASPHLRGLRALRLWVWADPADALRCLPLASLPALEEVALRKINGGIEDGDLAEEREREMDDVARRFAEKTRARVHVERPYARKFPLDGDVWRDLYAGHTRDGRPTLVLAGRASRLLFFDDDGRLAGQEECDLDAAIVLREYDKGERLEHLRRLYGFELGLIHVREFSLDDPMLWIGMSFVEEPIDVFFWQDDGNFEINLGGGDSWWAGPDGKVHST